MKQVVAINSPFASTYIGEILDHIAGEPAVNAGRHVHDAALNAADPRRLRHLLHQQLRQQKMT